MIARMEWASLGWRDGILLLVALAAIYLVLMLLKLVQVKRRQVPVEPVADEVTYVESDAEEPRLPGFSPATAVSAYAREAAVGWEEARALLGDAAETEPPAASGAAAGKAGFGEHLADHLARTEVETEIQRMRDEMERMRQEVENLRASRRVSPQYAEAMEMVQRGMSAQEVADRMSISLAEAELVQSLSRGRQNLEEGEHHGADGFAPHPGRDRRTG